MSLLLPVRYPAKLYSHNDPDAPQISNTDGAIKTIIKACLVTGYGAKAGAGWTALFEDGFRIVLRLPDVGRALGSPELKIENGGGKYRVVSQNDPAGLDDAAEVANVPLLSRDNRCGTEWHVVATDVGFLMWYQMAESDYGTAKDKGFFLVYSAVSALLPSDSVTFVCSFSNMVSATTGIGNPWMARERYKDMLNNADLGIINYTRADINQTDVDVFQNFALSKWVSPVEHSLNKNINQAVAPINVGGRAYLRLLLQNNYNPDAPHKNIYVTTDYWEV